MRSQRFPSLFDYFAELNGIVKGAIYYYYEPREKNLDFNVFKGLEEDLQRSYQFCSGEFVAPGISEYINLE